MQPVLSVNHAQTIVECWLNTSPPPSVRSWSIFECLLMRPVSNRQFCQMSENLSQRNVSFPPVAQRPLASQELQQCSFICRAVDKTLFLTVIVCAGLHLQCVHNPRRRNVYFASLYPVYGRRLQPHCRLSDEFLSTNNYKRQTQQQQQQVGRHLCWEIPCK